MRDWLENSRGRDPSCPCVIASPRHAATIRRGVCGESDVREPNPFRGAEVPLACVESGHRPACKPFAHERRGHGVEVTLCSNVFRHNQPSTGSQDPERLPIESGLIDYVAEALEGPYDLEGRIRER